jgi:mersacidin/lichenicidin family type 2 lantibiotic
MSDLNIIRAWKDAEYRQSLSEAERALLPEHPAGLIELADADLNAAGGRPRGGGCDTWSTVECTYATMTNDCRICCCTGDISNCNSELYGACW